MQLKMVSDDGKLVRVRCEGRITLVDVAGDSDPLADLLAGHGGFGRKVLLDLERATFLDSSGIGWLLVCHKRFVQGGGRFVVHSTPPLVLNVVNLIRLPLVVSFAPDEPAAEELALREGP
jgi:anti-anti-sigma factor